MAQPATARPLRDGSLDPSPTLISGLPFLVWFANDSPALDLPSMLPSRFGIKTPPDNACRGQTNHRLIHWIIGTKQGVSSFLNGLGDPSDLDSAGLPGWQDIIDHQSDMGIGQDVAKLLAPTEILSPNVDHILLGIIAEPHRGDLGGAVRPHRSETRQTLTLQIRDFLGSYDAHASFLLLHQQYGAQYGHAHDPFH